MSGVDKWFPLYIADYLADTMHLTNAEHGSYLLLLMHYWRHGPLPDDDRALAAIARCERRTWDKGVGATVRAFFRMAEGHLHHKRVDAERAKAAEVSAKRAAAAFARWGDGSQQEHHPKRERSNGDAHASANAGANDDAGDVTRARSPSQPYQSHSLREEGEAKASLVVADAPPPPAPPDRGISARDVQDAVDAWNRVCVPAGLPQCLALSEKRRAAVKARIRDLGEGWRGVWETACGKIAASSFCRGDDGGWRASFDWLLRPDTILKVMEGKYDRSATRRPLTAADAAIEGARRLAARVRGDAGDRPFAPVPPDDHTVPPLRPRTIIEGTTA